MLPLEWDPWPISKTCKSMIRRDEYGVQGSPSLEKSWFPSLLTILLEEDLSLSKLCL